MVRVVSTSVGDGSELNEMDLNMLGHATYLALIVAWSQMA